MLEILQFGFIQRAIASGIILALVLAFLGIFVVARRMAFFGDGIAHSSLAGIAIGMFAGFHPLVAAIVYTLILNVIMYWLEKKTQLFSDTIIGIFFTSSLALGIILISLSRAYKPDLVSFLFGNILSVSVTELAIIAVFGALVLLFLAFGYRKLTLLTLDPQGAYLRGMRTVAWELSLYIALALAVVLGVKLLGIVLVSAFLVIPVSCAKLITRSFRSLTFVTIILSAVITMSGIFLSFYLDLPTGAVIVLTGFVFFLLLLLLSRWKTIN